MKCLEAKIQTPEAVRNGDSPIVAGDVFRAHIEQKIHLSNSLRCWRSACPGYSWRTFWCRCLRMETAGYACCGEKKFSVGTYSWPERESVH